ncbi:MAG TPA: hypothetical protein VK826_07355 [Bacteroidia bacterium]|nr:hypothetical protein [Bacteroidia bacterium]
MTYRVEILNPKAGKLLQDLADLNLITISENEDDSLSGILKKLRTKAKKNAPTLAAITREVDLIRKKRYAKEKR